MHTCTRTGHERRPHLALPQGEHSLAGTSTSQAHVCCAQNKKHYNSFNPRGGFWLDLYETIELARRGEHTVRLHLACFV